MEFKAPAVPEQFHHTRQTGLDIYIDKRVRTAGQPIEFRMDKFLMLEKVIVRGLDIDFERK